MANKDKWLWVGVVALVAAAFAVLPPLLADDVGSFWEGMLGLAMMLALAVLYFVPTIIAVKRKHKSTGGIVALNILAGWTFVGWLIALVWSLSSPQQVVVQQVISTAPRQYQTGDVVNGYRFNGQTWESLQ